MHNHAEYSRSQLDVEWQIQVGRILLEYALKIEHMDPRVQSVMLRSMIAEIRNVYGFRDIAAIEWTNNSSVLADGRMVQVPPESLGVDFLSLHEINRLTTIYRNYLTMERTARQKIDANNEVMLRLGPVGCLLFFGSCSICCAVPVLYELAYYLAK